MEKIAGLIVRHKKAIIIIFAVVTIVCGLLMTLVKVNYNMVDYLPPNAQSTSGLKIMTDEFTQPIPNASVMIRDVSITQALEYKKKLSGINGVAETLWLDDVIDIRQPLEMSDTDTVNQFYKDGNALLSLTITKGMEKDTCEAIQNLIGEGNALTGEAPEIAFMQQSTGTEVFNAMAILLPLVIIILVLATVSWMEPLLYIAAIGISILINMGTNIFLGEISFMTNSVTPILQLACSLDFAIFLLHSFNNNRKKYLDPKEAMRHSIKESIPTITACAATVMFGFLALVFMNFRIGADLGIALAKGIIISFISVMVFLPGLTLALCKFTDKTAHRPLMPGFKNVNKVLSKLFIPVSILVIILIVPCFLGQSKTDFTYGVPVASDSRSGQDSAAIKETFGQSTVAVLLVPRENVVKEEELCRDIESIDHVTSVVSYTTKVGSAIPSEFLEKNITEQFYSDNYARIVIYTDTQQEGEIAFKTVENIQSTAEAYYGDSIYMVGQSVNLYDMKDVVNEDSIIINIIAIIAVFIVLLITFKSGILPVLLLIAIEAAIWINLAIPYFSGTPINYIGYLIVNTVQLGSTVDYAILLTITYMRMRKMMPKKEAISQTLGYTFKPILISAATLASAGFTLYLTSSNPVISVLGMLLGQGTLLSMLLVVCFLPAMLFVFDGAIGKTTFRADFFGKKKTKKNYLEEHNESQIN